MEGMNIISEEEKIRYPNSFKWGTFLNWILLAVHFILLVTFGFVGAWIMVLVNVFSVFFYSRAFVTIKDKPDTYMKLTFIEILFHMLAAVVCVGWDCGFQQYCFAVVGIVFFSNHLLLRDGAKGFQPMVFCVFSGIAYMFSRFVGLHLSPVYDVTPEFEKILFTLNGMLVLVLISLVSYIYVSGIQENETDLMDVAEYDALTQLANRHRIDRVLPLYGIDKDGSSVKYAIAIMDIDNFKKVNDNFGHLAGDQVLKDIARILRNYEGKEVLVFRWGGEEFMIITVGDDPYAKLMDICEKVRCDVAGNVSMFEYYRIVVTISSGVAEIETGEDFKALTERADKCLYHAKGNGKNQVVGAKEYLADKE